MRSTASMTDIRKPHAASYDQILAEYENSARRIRRNLLYFLAASGTLVIGALAALEAVHRHLHVAALLLIFALGVIVAALSLWRFHSVKWASRVAIAVISGLLAHVIYTVSTGSDNQSLLFWTYCMTPPLFVLSQRRTAYLIFIGFLLLFIVLSISNAELIRFDSFTWEAKTRYIFSFICVFIFVALQDRAQELRQKALMDAGDLLNRLSLTDQLTGLLNRRAMQEKIGQEHSRLHRSGCRYSIIYMDIDHFKSINDQYGHAAGDAVLAAVADFLKTNIRAHDSVARWGGEEFLLLLPETPLQRAVEAAQKLRRAVENLRIVTDTLELTVTMSAGVAEAIPELSVDKIISTADTRLYEAKRRGRNTVVPD